MEKVTYFDVEYANSNNKSICQMGLMCENFNDGESFYPERDIYINPEDGFDNMCIQIHGITAEKVKDKPNFPTIWKDIEKYFTNAVIVGHNVASADLDALIKSLRRYNLDIPQLYYICTLELAKEFIQPYEVDNYSMSSLCKFLDVDIDTEHNAFDDACANADLFKALIETYNIDIDSYVKKYIPHESKEFTQFIASPLIRKSISEFYGIIRGFSIDNTISSDEINYLIDWKNEHYKYSNIDEITAIVKELDKVLKDGIVTNDEIIQLQSSVKSYLDLVTTSPITLATQILDGILKGITTDGIVSENECKNLRQWLYDNIYLKDHFPFNKTMEILDKVLEDSKITLDESKYITETINNILNPVEALREQINSVDGKHVVLSGVFEMGSRVDVQNKLIEQGAIIDSSVKRTTDILMIGNFESQAYSNGSYGTKVKKALEYNESGCNIQIIKESDYFKN